MVTSVNRRRWLQKVQMDLVSAHSRLNLYREQMRRLGKKLTVFQQIASAPRVYAITVVEVTKRKMFAQHYDQVRGGRARECMRLRASQPARCHVMTTRRCVDAPTPAASILSTQPRQGDVAAARLANLARRATRLLPCTSSRGEERQRLSRTRRLVAEAA